MLKPAVNLVPTEGAERIGGDLVARSEQPWLRIVDAETWRGQWIRLRYRSSFFDDPVRPLLRFETATAEASFQTLNGPVLGSGEAIVRVPDGTVSVSISPVAKAGRFDFVVDAIEAVPRATLFADGLRREPGWALVAAGARLIRARQEAQQDLKFAIGATSFADYDAWHRNLARPLDLDGIDRPRTDWRVTPHIRLFAVLPANNGAGIDATLASLRTQAYTRWTLHALIDPRSGGDAAAKYRSAMRGDPRLAEISPNTTIEDLRLSPDDRAAVIEAGDTMPDHALAVVVEAIADDLGTAIAYGDEDAAASDGALHSPLFKPNWSPAFQAANPYLGRLTCIRCADLVGAGCVTPEQLIAAEQAVVNSVANLDGKQKVAHVRRILYRRRRERDVAGASPQSRMPAVAASIAAVQTWPTVTVIVPSRDRAGYLRGCIEGLKETTDYPSFDVVVVDNGSVEGDAIALLGEIESDRQITVLRVPGPFNYSALCNHGAAKTKADVLVLLNNDIVMIEPGWLQSLAAWAARGDVGAVGAKLLYPNGKIQHAGIVIGSGGRAGHLYKGAPGDEPGYLHQLQVAHEVAAVTGACLAVARSKFEAVGGFDAANLPVDLNDVDLCLRLSERGWRTIWTPDAVLSHVEGGSRRHTLRPAKTYGAERRYFVRRWSHVIRDDPYFHPALSLFSHRPALA